MAPSEKTSDASVTFGVGQRLGRHVDERLGLDQILDVRDPARGRGGLPDADLPVEDLEPGRSTRGVR